MKTYRVALAATVVCGLGAALVASLRSSNARDETSTSLASKTEVSSTSRVANAPAFKNPPPMCVFSLGDTHTYALEQDSNTTVDVTAMMGSLAKSTSQKTTKTTYNAKTATEAALRAVGTFLARPGFSRGYVFTGTSSGRFVEPRLALFWLAS